MVEEPVQGKAQGGVYLFTGDLPMLSGLPVRWPVTACIYHELFSTVSYFAVAASALVAYFVVPFRKKDDVG